MTSLKLQQYYPFLPPPITKHPGSILFTNSSSSSKSKLSSFCLSPSNAEPSRPTSQNPPETDQAGPVDRVKLAFESAEAYKKKLTEKKGAKVDVGPGGGPVEEEKKEPKSDALLDFKDKVMQEKKDEKSGSNGIDDSARKLDEPPLSKIDFVGLDFGEKKSGRGLPPGLRPIVDRFPEEDMPEVTIIVGDTSKFGYTSTPTPKLDGDDNSNVYEPKVSTWGVFPRPANISKTFGGGRSIQPGEELETEEERAAKQKRTRELIAAYKRKTGVVIDPKVKLECEKVLMDGDSLMDSGNLREALPYYQEVMDKLPFETELHGLAALQWAICQDSLGRQKLARPVYEKLQTHPNPEVNKKASLFVFSFQAMKMMKVTGSNFVPKDLGYQKYFDAFVEDEVLYPTGEPETQEDLLTQALPYMILLVSPIFFVLVLTLQRGNVH